MEQYEISKLLNDSNVSKFVTKKRIEVNHLQMVNILVGRIIGVLREASVGVCM